MVNPVTYIFGILYLLFGKIIGSIIGIIILLVIVYIIDKIGLSIKKQRYFGRTEPRFPKAHLSYWVDKYIFSKIKIV